jgi:hypothetical protein
MPYNKPPNTTARLNIAPKPFPEIAAIATKTIAV